MIVSFISLAFTLYTNCVLNYIVMCTGCRMYIKKQSVSFLVTVSLPVFFLAEKQLRYYYDYTLITWLYIGKSCRIMY